MHLTRTPATILATASLAALGLAASPPQPAAAQTTANGNTYYSSGGPFTIDAAHSVIGTAYVGEDSTGATSDAAGQPYSPTVTLVSGGSVADSGSGAFYSGSLLAFNATTVDVSGGTISKGLYPTDTSTANVSGGSVGNVFADNSSTITVSGGSVLGLDANNAGTVLLSGGTVGGSMVASDGSTVIVSGGTVAGFLVAGGTSRVTVSGGTFGTNQGVTFRDTTTSGFSFVGAGLTAVPTGVDPSFGGTDYTLAGFLQGGQSVTGDVINVGSGAAMFSGVTVVAPEPSQSAALGLGVLGLAGLALKVRRRPTAA